VRWAALVAVVVASGARAAAAQPTPPPPEPEPVPAPPRPWAEGVDAEHQTRALDLFREGNVYFAKNEYAAAVGYYREALEAWDHPAVHGNLAVALINLEQPLKALDHLDAALRWGPDPLDPGVYQQLETNRSMLHAQLARVEIGCEPVMEVSLDGEPVTCPAAARYALPGPHQVVARQADHLTMAKSFEAPAGQLTQVGVTLVPLSEATEYERRYPEWVPWTVAGAGVAVTLVGALLNASAVADIDKYDREIARSCPDGCVYDDLPEAVRDLQSRATWERRAAATSFVLGGAALVTGATLVYLNRPREVRVDTEGRRVAIVPGVSRDAVWVGASLRF